MVDLDKSSSIKRPACDYKTLTLIQLRGAVKKISASYSSNA